MPDFNTDFKEPGKTEPVLHIPKFSTTDSVFVRPLIPIQSSTDSGGYPDIAHLNNTTHFYYIGTLEKKKNHLRGYKGIFRCWMTGAVYLGKNGSIYLSGKDHFS